MRLVAIAAVTNEFGIGNNGKLPWHPRRLSLDMAFFSHITTNSFHFNGNSIHFVPANQNPYVIMGRLTWESLPCKLRPLKNRKNIIVSSRSENSSTEDVKWVDSFSQALAFCENTSMPVYSIGGSKIYEATLSEPNLDCVFLTKIVSDSHMACDAIFPIQSMPSSFNEINITSDVFHQLSSDLKLGSGQYLRKVDGEDVFVDNDLTYSIYAYKK
jgi:dihydrofolate reductase